MSTHPSTAVEDSARAGLRERKKRRTRRELHRAALNLVAEHGPAGVTVEQIAAAAGVSSRTFFNYYATKEAAIIGVPIGLDDQIAAEFDGRPAQESSLDRIHAVVLARLQPFEDDPELRELRRTVLHAHPELLSSTVQVNRDLELALARAVARREGLDADVDLYPRLLAAVALAAARAAVVVAGTRVSSTPSPWLARCLDEAFAGIERGLAHPFI